VNFLTGSCEFFFASLRVEKLKLQALINNASAVLNLCSVFTSFMCVRLRFSVSEH